MGIKQLEKLLTPGQIAETLGLKLSVVYRMLRNGTIPSIRVTAGERKLSLRVRPSVLQRWLQAREVSR